jgi:hypothetical protein
VPPATMGQGGQGQGVAGGGGRAGGGPGGVRGGGAGAPVPPHRAPRPAAVLVHWYWVLIPRRLPAPGSLLVFRALGRSSVIGPAALLLAAGCWHARPSALGPGLGPRFATAEQGIRLNLNPVMLGFLVMGGNAPW